ncbi:hypothetical protein J3E69DRAFT_144581 [Trichoderma sp. SZMC 28015]
MRCTSWSSDGMLLLLLLLLTLDGRREHNQSMPDTLARCILYVRLCVCVCVCVCVSQGPRPVGVGVVRVTPLFFLFLLPPLHLLPFAPHPHPMHLHWAATGFPCHKRGKIDAPPCRVLMLHGSASCCSPSPARPDFNYRSTLPLRHFDLIWLRPNLSDRCLIVFHWRERRSFFSSLYFIFSILPNPFLWLAHMCNESYIV